MSTHGITAAKSAGMLQAWTQSGDLRINVAVAFAAPSDRSRWSVYDTWAGGGPLARNVDEMTARRELARLARRHHNRVAAVAPQRVA